MAVCDISQNFVYHCKQNNCTTVNLLSVITIHTVPKIQIIFRPCLTKVIKLIILVFKTDCQAVYQQEKYK